MPIPKPRILLPVVACVALAACGQPVPSDKAEYVGEWRADTMFLKVTQDGRVAYRRIEGNSRTSVDAPLQGFEGNDFKAGLGPISTTFKVSNPPHRDGAVWKMTVDGIELTRQ